MRSDKNNKCLLSIIIPLYNSASFLNNTLKPLILAHEKNDVFEIVLVDDGSTDNTEFLCNEIVFKYPFIRYFKKENGGIASSRNYGIRVAFGDYLFFHDHDDQFEIDNLKCIIPFLEKNDVDLFLFETGKNVTKGTRPLNVISQEYQGRKMSDQKSITNLFNTMFLLPNDKPIINKYGQIWSSIIRRRFVEKNNISFSLYCDFEDDFNFLFEVLSHRPVFMALKIKIYNWFVLDKSTSHSFLFSQKYLENLEVYQAYLKRLMDNSFFCEYSEQAISNIMWNKYKNFVVRFCSKKNKIKSLTLFKELCKSYNIRKHILVRVTYRRSFFQLLVVFLFKLKLYSLIYLLAKLKY